MGSLTGAGWHLSAAHRAVGGVLHGHTWEVVVWWHEAGEDATALQATLRSVLREYDHSELPDKLSRGEALAEFIGVTLAEYRSASLVHSVEVSRPAERIYAKWFAA